MPSIWQIFDTFIQTSNIVIDRPKGSAHPRYPKIIYPLDYGYLDNTTGGDGDGIDIWRGTLPDQKLDAIICSADQHKRDAEIKLLLGCTPEEKEIILNFLHSNEVGAILVERT